MSDVTRAESKALAQQSAFSASDFRTDLRKYWLLWLIVGAAVFLRFYEVHRLPGMHGDEAWYGLQARRLLAGEAVEWRTPTNNVPGMLHLGSLTLLHGIFPPSLFLLRLPALSLLAALLLAYATCRRFFGQEAAMAAAVVMACLPINIAYARLGWDPSHSPLLILASAFAAFAGRRLLCGLFFAFALINHPSAVFVAPFLTLAYLGFRISGDGLRSSVIDTVKLAALLLLGIVLGIAISPATTHYVSLSAGLSRLIDVQGWAQFGLMFCRLLSGDTIYTYSVGTGFGSALPLADWAVGAGLATILAAGVARRSRRRLENCRVARGYDCQPGSLYLAAGKWVLNPTLERFAYPWCRSPPSIRGDRRWHYASQTLASTAARADFSGNACKLLVSLHHSVECGRNCESRGFWTARQDPAKSAFHLISTDGPRSAVQDPVEDWWLYMPISYYAAGAPFDVINAMPSVIEAAASAGDTYWVTFGGSTLDQALESERTCALAGRSAP